MFLIGKVLELHQINSITPSIFLGPKQFSINTSIYLHCQSFLAKHYILYFGSPIFTTFIMHGLYSLPVTTDKTCNFKSPSPWSGFMSLSWQQGWSVKWTLPLLTNFDQLITQIKLRCTFSLRNTFK